MKSPTTKQELWDMIGHGWKLRLNKDKTKASLVDFEHNKMIIACNLQLALTNLDQLFKLTIMGTPPYTEPEERKRLGGWRMGIREMGWDESYDWYCHIQ